jgi:hypothetical protein
MTGLSDHDGRNAHPSPPASVPSIPSAPEPARPGPLATGGATVNPPMGCLLALMQPPPATPLGQYADSHAAAQAVRGDFDYWTGKLTETSLQLSYAVLGANWAVFGKVDAILSNGWSKLSLLCVIVSLASAVIGAKIMGERHRKQLDHAEEDTVRWQQEYEATKNHRDPWPYTAEIERLGRALRFVKTWLPLLAGLLFIIALLYPH